MSILTPLLDVTYQDQPIDLNSGLRKFCYYENAHGFAAVYIEVHDHKMEEVVQLMVNTAGTKPVKLRHGHWTVGGGAPKYSDWKDVLFNSVELNMVNLGRVSIICSGTCAGYNLWETIGTPGAFVKMKISDIVKAIAARNDMTADVEETVGTYTFYQADMTDAELLMLLLNYAVSVLGRADYKFFIKNGNTIVFKTPDYRNAMWHANWSTSAGEIFDMEPFSLLIKMNQKDMVSQNALFGEYRGFNPRSKEEDFFQINDDTPVGPVGQRAVASRLKAPSKPSNAIPVAAPDIELWTQDYVTNTGKASWSRNADNMFTAVIECAPLPVASPGQIVDINLTDVNGLKQVVSGKYYVYAASHNYVDSAFDSTKLYCQRRGVDLE
jgi:hypothetical protein